MSCVLYFLIMSKTLNLVWFRCCYSLLPGLANLKISCPFLKNSQITQIAWSKKLLAYCSEAGQGNRLTFLSILFPWYDQIQLIEFCVNWSTEGWLNTVREICMRNMTMECMKNWMFYISLTVTHCCRLNSQNCHIFQDYLN